MQWTATLIIRLEKQPINIRQSCYINFDQLYNFETRTRPSLSRTLSEMLRACDPAGKRALGAETRSRGDGAL